MLHSKICKAIKKIVFNVSAVKLMFSINRGAVPLNLQLPFRVLSLTDKGCLYGKDKHSHKGQSEDSVSKWIKIVVYKWDYCWMLIKVISASIKSFFRPQWFRWKIFLCTSFYHYWMCGIFGTCHQPVPDQLSPGPPCCGLVPAFGPAATSTLPNPPDSL